MPRNGPFHRSDEHKPALGSPNISYEGSHGPVDGYVSRKDSLGTRHRLSMADWWIWEIVCTVTSLLSWAAVCGVLSFANNKPQDIWTVSISLNAVISALVMLARGSMMVGVSSAISQSKWLHFKTGTRELYDMHLFDSASRGTLGSIRFLFRVRWQLSTIGALVTLLSVAVDPFAQQVIEIDARLIGIADKTASLAFTHRYHAGAVGSAFNIIGRPEPFSVDMGMHGAILKALFNLTEDIKDPYVCPGSCSWDGPFISMGFRSNCQDVTAATIGSKVCEINDSNKGRNCNMTTPGGLEISTMIVPTVQQSATIVTAEGIAIGPQDTTPNDFVRIAVWRAPPDTYNNNTNEIVGEEITECTLSLTAYSYTNLAANGTKFTQTVKEIPLVKNGTRAPIEDPVADVNPPNILFNEPGLPTFNISIHDWGAICQFFESKQFLGEIRSGSAENTERGVGPLPLSQSKNITRVFEDVAKSMTDQIRSTAPGMEVGFGLTNRAVGYVAVEWFYLTLPLGIAAASAILLAAMIFHNRRTQGVPLFKSSPLALLYHQVNSDDGTISGTGQSPRALEKMSRSVAVRLH